MNPPDLPVFRFSSWEHWSTRSRPSTDLDGVPEAFGILGVYMLAASAAKPTAIDLTKSTHLPSEVVYVGLSCQVEQRLERSHSAVRRYREQQADTGCNNLWYCHWRSDWSRHRGIREAAPLAYASIALYERALILAYVKQYGKLPALNRR